MSKITKKQLHNGWHCHDTEIIKMKKELRELKQSVLRLEKLTDEKLLDKPQLKQLDQRVFNNMHKRWKFAAIDADGSAHRYNKEVFPYGEGFCYEGDDSKEFKFSLIGKGYDASNWQNSLIEREPKPQLKQLDQSVFDALDEKWRFAAICFSGKAIATQSEPRKVLDGYYCENGYLLIGEGYHTLNWQNSLIERDIAKEPLEVDLSSELTGSDYYYSNITSALLESGSKLVVCFVSNLSESDALSEKHIEVILGLDVEFNDSDDYRWQYAIPINNQGEPLTAAEAGL